MNKAFEKIIDELKQESIIVDDDAGHRAVEIIEQIAEEYKDGWIPCSERLPEPIRPVLVTLRNWMNDKYFVRVGRFHADHWKTDEGIVENSVVGAWKPLPHPYQPKGE